jgi:hypothetical protein
MVTTLHCRTSVCSKFNDGLETKVKKPELASADDEMCHGQLVHAPMLLMLPYA